MGGTRLHNTAYIMHKLPKNEIEVGWDDRLSTRSENTENTVDYRNHEMKPNSSQRIYPQAFGLKGCIIKLENVEHYRDIQFKINCRYHHLHWKTESY